MRDWPAYICLFVRRIDVRGEAHSSLPYRLGYHTLARAIEDDAGLLYAFPRSRLIDRPALVLVEPRQPMQLMLDMEM